MSDDTPAGLPAETTPDAPKEIAPPAGANPDAPPADDDDDDDDDEPVAPPPEVRGESADEERPVPAPHDRGETREVTGDAHFAPRGGWLGPSAEAIAAGHVKRETVRPNDLMTALLTGKPARRIVCEGLNLSRKEITKPIEIDKSTLTRTNFKGTTFAAPVVFRHCVIENMDVQRAKFLKGVTFEACEFRSPMTTFKGFECPGNFLLRDCTMGGKLLIANASIGGNLDCWDTTFVGWVDFRGVTFGGLADFRSIDADEGFVFTACTFAKSVLFRGAVINKKFSFQRGCKLNGCLDLQKAKLHGFAYFDELEFQAEGTLSVWNCTANALLIKASQIGDRLQPLRDGDHSKAAEEYGVLKNNYQRLNWLDDEDWAYYHFKREQRIGRHGQKGGISRFFEYVIFDLACAYGTNPMRVLQTAAVIITFFALIYAGLLLATPGDGYEITSAVAAGTPTMKVYNIFGAATVDKICTAFIDSTSAFVSGFDGVDKNVEGWPALILTIEGLFGMLVLGLFIVAFSRKVIR
ncbi:MAG: hypothetical protein AB7K09_11015 [Planctomycetota bacterium]